MARKEKNIHYIYKTTCNVTGRWYIGMHSTTNLEDGYMGSGKILRYSIRKHGAENHTKEILEYCETREALVHRETEIITNELISDGLCMNLKEGGEGGFISEEQQKHRSLCANKKLNQLLENDLEFRKNWLLKMKAGVQKAMGDGKMKTWKDNYSWVGKNHSNESKNKTSETMKGYGSGSTNSQYGTCWITKDGENKKIKKEDLDLYLAEGWVQGRN